MIPEIIAKTQSSIPTDMNCKEDTEKQHNLYGVQALGNVSAEHLTLKFRAPKILASVTNWLVDKGVVRGDLQEVVRSVHKANLKKFLSMRENICGQRQGVLTKRLKRKLTLAIQ